MRIAPGPLVLVVVLVARAALAQSTGKDDVPWTSASLLRGPTAILNAPLVPFRTAAGGAHLALDDPAPGVKGKIMLTPLLTVVGGAMGLVDATVWLLSGLADTFTGGYFALAPEPATHLSVAPITPPFAQH
jgi:hypothetical protein